MSRWLFKSLQISVFICAKVPTPRTINTSDVVNVIYTLAGPKGEMVRLVCIPRFAETGTAVLVSFLAHKFVLICAQSLSFSSLHDIQNY